MPSPDSIGQRFTQLIQHLGLSKNAFAQSLDKTATVIQHLVDERNKPGYDLLCKVFDTYPNVSKDWLLQGDGPMLKTGSVLAAPASLEAASVPTPAPVANLFAVVEPVVAAPLAPVTPVPAAPVAVAQAQSVVPTPPAPAPESPPIFTAASVPATAPAPVTTAPSVAPAPDPAYFTVALQTQYLQHQLALAEQRNQHLLEQQALMQQMVALLQRAV